MASDSEKDTANRQIKSSKVMNNEIDSSAPVKTGPQAIRDEARLESLGYKGELKRDFTKFQTFGVAFSIMGVVPSIASTIIYSLPYGGPVSMIWGWLIAAGLISFIGLAMGELASSMPTSGGLYFWTHKLAPPEYRNFLAWMVGYNSFLGNIAAISSLAWACSTLFFAAVNLQNPDFVSTAGMTFGVYVAILIFCGFYCAYATPIFARLQTPSVFLNVGLALATIIGLPIACRDNLNTAQFTFGGWANLVAYPDGFAFIMSMLAPVWTICSFDCAVSISEEAANAAYAVPQAIIGAIGSAGVLGTLIMIILALTMGPDVAAVNDSAVGQPLAFIYLQGFGLTGSTVIWSFMCVAQLSMTSSLILPSSRQAFAFSRDGALPFSRYFYHLNSWTGTPVRTVWLVVGAAIPLGLLGFADPVNYAAINAIFTLAILGPYIAYGIPIASRLIWSERFKPGPWHLGRFSLPIAAIAVVWMVFAIVLFCFPADLDPDAGSMNYAIVVLAGVWVFATGYWFFPRIGGKTFFTGPMTHDFALEAEVLAISAQEDERDKKRSTGESGSKHAVAPVELTE